MRALTISLSSFEKWYDRDSVSEVDVAFIRMAIANRPYIVQLLGIPHALEKHYINY
jgi:hypothetical protein